MKLLLEKDTEKTGKIKEQDLEDIFQECKLEIEEKEADKLFQILDQNRTGQIDYRKFIKTILVCVKKYYKLIGKCK